MKLTKDQINEIKALQSQSNQTKRVIAPETLNKHQLVVPNWRVFDTI